jgi:hypothetical protein
MYVDYHVMLTQGFGMKQYALCEWAEASWELEASYSLFPPPSHDESHRI